MDALPADQAGAQPPGRGVAGLIDRGAWYSWRLLVIAAVVVAVLWLIGQLLVVVVPVAVAALLARALYPVYRRLRDRVRPGLAAVAALLGFVILLAALLGTVGVAVAGELDELGPTLSEGIDDVTTWLVDDSPFDVSREEVDEWRAQAGEAISTFLRSSGGSVASGAALVGEIIVGAILALIVTFFFLKDGARMNDAVLRTVAVERRPLARRTGARAWAAAGGYLRGAALLGLIESMAIGLALLLVGARLVVPVMLVTFVAAFVPIVGAVAAGVVAVLVAMVTAGPVPALIVAAVALVVQQLDNDLLAPLIYGRALQLHPLVILLGIVAGGALFGIIGTFFAVPFLAVTLNSLDEVRKGDQPTN